MSDTESDTASSVGSIVEDASEPDTTTFKDLFSDRQWTRVSDMVEHNKTENGFDLPATIKGLGPGTAHNVERPSIRSTPYPFRMTTDCLH